MELNFQQLEAMLSQTWAQLALALVALLLGLRLALLRLLSSVSERVRAGEDVQVDLFGVNVLRVHGKEKDRQQAVNELLALSGYTTRKQDNPTSNSEAGKPDS